MKKLEFSLPSDFKEDIQITGKRTKSYDSKKISPRTLRNFKEITYEYIR